jgi:ribosome-binding protein aMBF1 (putative translation factor)
MEDEAWVKFTCEQCGITIHRLKADHDGFNVCHECRWFGERPWIKRAREGVNHDVPPMRGEGKDPSA